MGLFNIEQVKFYSENNNSSNLDDLILYIVFHWRIKQ